MNSRFSLWFAGLGLLSAIVACFGEVPATTSPATISTIVVATMRAITPPPATATAAPASPTSIPAIPTATSSVTATRVNFLGGATTGVVSGPIAPGQTLAYVLQAGQGQPMLVRVDSPQNDVTLSISTQGGTSLLSASARQTSWQGTLPQTEDYVITLYGGAATQQFTLVIEIVSRINFATGTDQIKISGTTPSGYSVAYVVFALQNQKMDVEIYGVGRNAALTVWGYANGKTYLRAANNKTNFSFTVPRTQDYILEIDPKAGAILSYVIYVRIQE